MMRKQDFYTGYTEAQFAADKYFQQWVLEADEDAERFWNAFLQLHPEKVLAVSRARQLVEGLACNNDYGVTSPLSAAEKQAIKERIFSHLELPLYSDTPVPVQGTAGRQRPWLIWTAVAAAMVAVAAPVYCLMNAGQNVPGPKTTAFRTIAAGPGEIKKIVLPDSSVVLLNANSAIEYSGREVHLTGNAFFTIKKDNELKPFVITVRGMRIAVLGTQLNVDARSAQTEVTLTSGKIKVSHFAAGGGGADAARRAGGEDAARRAGGAGSAGVGGATDTAAVYLHPGEKLLLDTSSQTFVRSKVNGSLYSAWTENKWDFRQTNLEEITRLIKEYYGVDVVFKNEKDKHVRITALMAVSSLNKLLPVLSETLRKKMTLRDDQLIID
jgi:transmembrane sensor